VTTHWRGIDVSHRPLQAEPRRRFERMSGTVPIGAPPPPSQDVLSPLASSVGKVACYGAD
jgi:hypothetical protein